MYIYSECIHLNISIVSGFIPQLHTIKYSDRFLYVFVGIPTRSHLDRHLSIDKNDHLLTIWVLWQVIVTETRKLLEGELMFYLYVSGRTKHDEVTSSHPIIYLLRTFYVPYILCLYIPMLTERIQKKLTTYLYSTS